MKNRVIGNDGVGIAGDTFDSKLVRHLVAPMLGLGSKYLLAVWQSLARTLLAL